MKTDSFRLGSLRIRPTGFGVMFLFVLAAMTVGSMNYHANLGLLLSFLLAAITAVSLLHTHRIIRNIRILSASARPVFAGDTAVFNLQLSAEAPALTAVAFSFPPADETRQDIETGSIRQVSVTAATDRRGLFSPGPLLVATCYPLGLFSCTTLLPLEVRCLVYPRPLAGAAAVNRAAAATDGKGESTLAGMDDFRGLRPYQPGEPLERIYWKAFSRGQGLLLKQFTRTAGTTLLFDWEALGTGGIEQRLSILCGGIVQAHQQGMVYGLKLPGRIISSDRGEAHFKTCLKALALFDLPPDAPESWRE